MSEKLTKEIIAKAVSGDRRAFDRIYTACEGRLRSYIRGHLNDKSQEDDVLQNTFIAVYNNIGQLRSPDGFGSWLYSIAYNECMNVNKATKRETERFTSMNVTDEDGDEREFEDDSLELPEDYATNRELQKLLAGELNALPGKQRDCLILYYYKHMSIPEIAKMYSVSESSIKTRKDKAVGKLKRRLEKYRGSYNFAFVPLGGLMGSLIGTGKVKSACLGTAVVKSASAGVVAAAVIGVAGFAGVGYLNYMGDKHDYSDKSIVIEDKSDSEADLLKEYEMPDELKNLEWTEPAPPKNDDNSIGYLINKTAESAVLIENGIKDFRLLKNDHARFTEDMIQIYYTPLYSSAEEYTDLVPVFALGFMPAGPGYIEKYDKSKISVGNIYIEDGKVVFSFERIHEDIPDSAGFTFQLDTYQVGENQEDERENIIFASSNVPKGYTYSIMTMINSELHPDCPPVPEYNDTSGYADSGDDPDKREECFRIRKEYQAAVLDYYSNYPEYMYYYIGNGAYPRVGNDYTFNMNDVACYPENNAFADGVGIGCFLHEDGSINIDNRIPKIYLGKNDENGEPLPDPYNQVPYEKIKKINVGENNKGSVDGGRLSYRFETANDCLYYVITGINGQNDDGENYTTEMEERTLLWIPPDTHYTELNLPDHLTAYYSDEALQRLNADHIYLGADSEGFIEQLENSSDEKAQAILAQIRADNDI